VLCEPLLEYDDRADIEGFCEVLGEVDMEGDSNGDWDALADEVGDGPLMNLTDAVRPLYVVDVNEVNCIVIVFEEEVQL
jgi:hypothetical protein